MKICVVHVRGSQILNRNSSVNEIQDVAGYVIASGLGCWPEVKIELESINQQSRSKGDFQYQK